MNIYKLAATRRLRFATTTTKGQIMVEDLQDLKLAELDACFKHYNRNAKIAAEESLLAAQPAENTDDALRIAILRDIVADKQAEAAEKLKARERQATKSKLMDAIARKQDEAISAKSLDELMAELNAL